LSVSLTFFKFLLKNFLYLSDFFEIVEYFGYYLMKKFLIILIFTLLIGVITKSYSETVGASGANYETLKAAFDDINDGILTGDVVLQIIDNTTETASAVLNASGSGDANYISVTIYPTSLGLSISGDLAAPLIDLRGADNVTIDGRVNQSGTDADLSIINESTSTDAGTCTIRLINDATNNDIKYCNIRGSSLSTSDGIISFSTTDGTSGNDDNTIEHNRITNFNSNRPINAIFSLGTDTKENSGNVVSNNNIYDFLSLDHDSNGLSIVSNNTAWTISYNSFYETTTMAPTVNTFYSLIVIINSGGDYDISNNYFGGNSSLCSGTWQKTNSANSFMSCVYLDSDLDNTISNNTIKEFNFSNSGRGEFYGLVANNNGSSTNTTTISNNTIGATTGTGSIVLNNDDKNGAFYGIYLSGSCIFDITSNNIGSITTTNTNNENDTDFYGICLFLCDYEVSCSNNLIGSTETANSINTISESTLDQQTVFGIFANLTNESTGEVAEADFSNNTIANLTNNTRRDDSSPNYGPILGIYTKGGDVQISDNSIHDLKIDSFNNIPFSLRRSSVIIFSALGLFIEDANTISGVTGNSIFDISSENTSDYPVFMGGIYITGLQNQTNFPISNNFISNIYSSSSYSEPPSSTVIGIYNEEDVEYYNNIISMGNNIDDGFLIIGVAESIFEPSDNGCNFYFNTVSVGGSTSDVTGGSYAYLGSGSESDISNNILSNTRSGGATNYAIGLSDNTNLTIDYNDYYSEDILGNYNGTDKTTLGDWQTATGEDANSITTDPDFVNSGGTDPEDYKPGGFLEGNTVSTITEDYAGTTRDDPPTMGAYEYESKLFYVKHDASGNNDGTSWTDAFTSLQSALDEAGSKDEIWVAAGTYFPSQGWDVRNGTTSSTAREESFRIPSGVKVYGGFAGSETATSQRVNFGSGEANETILSGDLSQNDPVVTDNAYHVVCFYQANTETRLDGFTITDGNANENNPNDRGGGIYNRETGNPTISNCTIMENFANFGSGIYNYLASPTITLCWISENSAGWGGGIFNYSSSPLIENCIISANTSSGNAGGLENYDNSLPTLINCLISGNSAASQGGGISNYSNGPLNSPTITNCSIVGNVATIGGGVSDVNSSPSIENSIIWNNSALSSGPNVKNNFTSSPSFSYCNVQGSGGSGSGLWGDFGTDNGDNIDADPFFVTALDPADAPTTSGDFRLYNGSPCLNSGNNSANSETFDLAGNARFQGGTIDMGAYEGGVARGRIYVDADASGTNSGFSWTDAYEDLQNALEASTSGDEIWVAAGTYKPSKEYNGATGTPREFIFRMKNGVEIYGGFHGDEDYTTFDLDDRDFERDETILSGDHSDNDDFDVENGGYQGTTGDENCYHVFYSSNYGLTSSAVLDGFTISGGNANGSGDHRYGSGMFISEDDPSLRNLIFKNNSSTYTTNQEVENGGCAIYFYKSTCNLTNALFINNYGGAVLAHGSSESTDVKITNATFSGNYNPGYGGAIQLWDATIYLNNCILWNNYAGEDGNEIYESGDFNGILLSYCCYKYDDGDVFGTIYTAHCITSNPKFVNPDNDDFTLYSTSPCVNTGNNVMLKLRIIVVEKDLRGEDRIQNTTIDMGAYEWTSGIDPTIPTVITSAISNITHNSAQSGGNVTDDGGASVTARGVCWNTSQNPTTSESKTTDGTGVGEFVSSITGLSPQTQYYARAYAENGGGDAYGSNMDFRTLSNEPTAQASNLQAEGTSSTQIDLSWDAATFPASGATNRGYVLLRAQSPNNPIFDSQDGETPAAGAITTIVSQAIGEVTSYNDNTGLLSDTRYNYLLIPFCWDGTNQETYNYLTINAPTDDGTTLKAEPTNHVTDFRTGDINHNSIQLLWNDSYSSESTVAPDGYLIRGSSVSYATISAPTDGTPIADGSLDKNVNPGVENHRFTGLTANTQYYFKIYPYTNSGTGIDYKTDDNVPQTTGTPTLRPAVWVSENYCDVCPNDGHTWGYDCFDNMTDALAAIQPGGTVYTDGVHTTENLNIGNNNFDTPAKTKFSKYKQIY
jgi:hypothetical protein